MNDVANPWIAAAPDFPKEGKAEKERRRAPTCFTAYGTSERLPEWLEPSELEASLNTKHYKFGVECSEVLVPLDTPSSQHSTGTLKWELK